MKSQQPVLGMVLIPICEIRKKMRRLTSVTRESSSFKEGSFLFYFKQELISYGAKGARGLHVESVCLKRNFYLFNVRM